MENQKKMKIRILFLYSIYSSLYVKLVLKKNTNFNVHISLIIYIYMIFSKYQKHFNKGK